MEGEVYLHKADKMKELGANKKIKTFNQRMKILIYSFNDKIGDGFKKFLFSRKKKNLSKFSNITYTTTNTTTLKK